MNINKSLDILNLKHGYTYIELKKSYHINALIYHPDKNSIDTTEKFKDINTAYKILNENLNNENLNNENLNNENLNNEYLDLIYSFIIFLSNNNNQNSPNKISTKGEEIIKKILDKLTLEIIEDIYLLVENNTSLLAYIDEHTKTLIINSIKQYIENYTVIILKPDIHNLINRDVYKLKINDEIIYIPLWHNKLIYQKNIIDIQPDLSENIVIKNHNIYYRLEKKYYDIINLINSNNNYLYIDQLDKYIDITCMQFKKYQTIILKNKGLPKIDYNNNFSLSNYSDIIVELYLS
tara:strand:- start:220 stop:1098 length:879 start_codon:yes stop_codon:yes gene_type:complete